MKDRVFEIRADLVNTFVREGAFTSPVEGLTVYVASVTAAKSAHPGPRRGANPKSVATYMAQRGTLATTPQGPRLIMDNGNVHGFEGGEGRLKILKLREIHLRSRPVRQAARQPARAEASERYLGELLNPEAGLTPGQRKKYYAEAHNRLSAPLFCIVFALIAVTALVGGTSTAAATRDALPWRCWRCWWRACPDLLCSAWSIHPQHGLRDVFVAGTLDCRFDRTAQHPFA